jgi:hypothetical protein
MRDTCRVFVGNNERKASLGRHTLKREDNIKNVLKN